MSRKISNSSALSWHGSRRHARRWPRLWVCGLGLGQPGEMRPDPGSFSRLPGGSWRSMPSLDLLNSPLSLWDSMPSCVARAMACLLYSHGSESAVFDFHLTHTFVMINLAFASQRCMNCRRKRFPVLGIRRLERASRPTTRRVTTVLAIAMTVENYHRWALVRDAGCLIAVCVPSPVLELHVQTALPNQVKKRDDSVHVEGAKEV